MDNVYNMLASISYPLSRMLWGTLWVGRVSTPQVGVSAYLIPRDGLGQDVGLAAI